MANSVDPDEMARYEPARLDLHCLHRYLFWSAMLFYEIVVLFFLHNVILEVIFLYFQCPFDKHTDVLHYILTSPVFSETSK